MYLFIQVLLVLLFRHFPDNWQTVFEKSKGKQTATYQECQDFYKRLDEGFSELKVLEYGLTDIGKPLSLVVISNEKAENIKFLQQSPKPVLLINNAIHAGEPDGVDASMLLARDLVVNPELRPLLDKVIVLIIPMYNIDGVLNRNSVSRVNQNGPESYGFRGNAKNLDLNRDFVKCDSRNAASFIELFQACNPDVFIDTHASNGADYQYVMTYIASQKDKSDKGIADYMHGSMIPEIQNTMKTAGYEMCPYVNLYKTVPDSGLVGFYDSPRYSSGYASLNNSISFITETHMLKPFDSRVNATYRFLLAAIQVMSRDGSRIKTLRKKAFEADMQAREYVTGWKLDPQTYETIEFKGYQAKYKPSEVSGQERLYYDHNAPYSKKIRFWNTYLPQEQVKKPYAYIIPQAWSAAADALKRNGIEMKRLTKDTSINVEMYYISTYESRFFEGHYLHYKTKTRTENQVLSFYRGDYIVYTQQLKVNYIMEALEPAAFDSYFNWNFFDGILSQKEYFSDYIFEDKAAEMLRNDPALRKMLDEKKHGDSTFMKNGYAQLDFIYRQSPHYEKSHLRYPVARFIQEKQLPAE